MVLLFALLANTPPVVKDVIPSDFQGPAWVALAATGLAILHKLVNMASDYTSAKRIQRDEERLKKEATQVAPTTVPFIPESLEARIFRLEKDRLEDALRAERASSEEQRAENARLRERNADLQDQVLLEQRMNADLRIQLRRVREERERDTRITEPIKR